MTKYQLEEFKKWAKENHKEFGKWDVFMRVLWKRESYWFNYRCRYIGRSGSEFTYFDASNNEGWTEEAEPYFKVVDEYKAQLVGQAQKVISQWLDNQIQTEEDLIKKEFYQELKSQSNLKNIEDLTNLKQTFNQQLKELNILIDPQAEHYTEPIQFEGFKESLKNELTKLKNESSTFQEQDKTIQDLQQKVSDLTNQNQDLNSNLQTRTNELTTKEQDLQKLQTKLEKTKQVAQKNINLAKQKVSDLEDQLLSLAKQKLKGKKQAQQLLTQLETNLKDKQKELTNLQLIRQQEQTELESELKQQKELLTQSQTNLQLHQQKIKALETQLVSLSTQKITTQQTLTRTHQQLTQTQTHYTQRKHQALLIGIIGLMLIIYLGWPQKNDEVKDEARTWI